MPSYVFKIKSIYNKKPFFKGDGLPTKAKKIRGLFSSAKTPNKEEGKRKRQREKERDHRTGGREGNP